MDIEGIISVDNELAYLVAGIDMELAPADKLAPGQSKATSFTNRSPVHMRSHSARMDVSLL